MGHLAPLHSLIWVAIALATFGIVHSQDIVFPSTKQTETCTLPSGVTGTCVLIKECPMVAENIGMQYPKICRFQGKTPIVCCPRLMTSDPIRIEDISPPIINFDCGKEYYTLDTGPNSFQPLLSQSVSNIRRKRNLQPDGFFEPEPPPVLQPPTAPICPAIYQGAVGGTEVFKNAYPWMALLGEDRAGKRTWFCGGVLLNRRWVLTAAHCTNARSTTVVRLGEHDFTKDDEVVHEDFGVAEIVYNPGYKPPVAYHDIALIRLKRPAKIRREISPVCLPWGQEADQRLEGKAVTVSGWGSTRFFGDELSPFLNEISVTVLPVDVCTKSYSRLNDYTVNYPQSLGEESLCIGDTANETIVKDSCPGDSGGPAVLRKFETYGEYTLIGIVSKGFGCGKREFPGIYVAIQHPKHLAWIKSVAFSNIYEFQCEQECLHGTCIGRNTCQCDNGWEGKQCQIPICSPGCVNGKCVDVDICECDDGWDGLGCVTPLCHPPCCWDCIAPNICRKEASDPCINGYYSFLNFCVCDAGWTGEICDTALLQ